MPSDLSQGNSRPPSVDELDKILTLAEDLQDKTERGDRRVELYDLALSFCVGTIGLSLLDVVWRLALSKPLDSSGILPLDLLAAAVAIVTAMAVFIALRFRLSGAKRRILPDRVALNRLVGLIREVEGAVALSQQWTPLQRAQIQIRLSRLTVGEPGASEPDVSAYSRRMRNLKKSEYVGDDIERRP